MEDKDDITIFFSKKSRLDINENRETDSNLSEEEACSDIDGDLAYDNDDSVEESSSVRTAADIFNEVVETETVSSGPNNLDQLDNPLDQSPEHEPGIERMAARDVHENLRNLGGDGVNNVENGTRGAPTAGC